MIELRERWAGYNQGEVYQVISAEAYAPVQPWSKTRCLRIATGSETCVHPSDWPPFEGVRETGRVWPNKSEGEGKGDESPPPSFPGGKAGLPSPEE